MQIWFGIGDHEVQIDYRGPGLTLSLPKPGRLDHDDSVVMPVEETEDTWGYELTPADRGYDGGSGNRCWPYVASYLWQNPNTQEIAPAEIRIVLCRDEGGVWGVCFHSEPGTDTLLAFPKEVADGLEMAFQSHPLPWTFVPHLIQGGAQEETG